MANEDSIKINELEEATEVSENDYLIIDDGVNTKKINKENLTKDKVDKIDGKGLSTNDYTNEEKNKLAGIAEGANKYVHPSYTARSNGLYKVTVDSTGHVSATTVVKKADITGLGIPAQDTTYSSKAAASGGTDVSLVTTGEKYTWNNKQNTLVNGTNIKTINGNSILGSGNLIVGSALNAGIGFEINNNVGKVIGVEYKDNITPQEVPLTFVKMTQEQFDASTPVRGQFTIIIESRGDNNAR